MFWDYFIPILFNYHKPEMKYLSTKWCYFLGMELGIRSAFLKKSFSMICKFYVLNIDYKIL